MWGIQQALNKKNIHGLPGGRSIKRESRREKRKEGAMGQPGYREIQVCGALVDISTQNTGLYFGAIVTSLA